MNNGVVMELECPRCGEYIECDDHQVMATRLTPREIKPMWTARNSKKILK